MSDHISSFLNLKCHITETRHKLDDILIVDTILYFLPYFNIQDIVKWNLLDKEKGLTLDILITDLISIHDYAKHNCLAVENKKSQI